MGKKSINIVLIIFSVIILIISFYMNKYKLFGKFTLFLIMSIILIVYNLISLIIFSKKVDEVIKEKHIEIKQEYTKKPKQPEFSIKNYVRCPFCGRIIKRDFNFCPFCGARIK